MQWCDEVLIKLAIRTYVFALVESLRNFPSEYSVNSTNDDQNDRICESDHVASVDIAVAHKEIIFSGRIMMSRFCRINNHPHSMYKNLYSDEHATNNDLRTRRYERWPFCASLSGVEYTRNPVCFCQESRVHYREAKTCGESENIFILFLQQCKTKRVKGLESLRQDCRKLFKFIASL